MKKLIIALAVAALTFTGSAFAKGSFGGSRGSGSSFSSGSRSSSFGGSRSGSSSSSSSSKSSSFGGSRSSGQPAPIVRKQAAPSTSSTSSNSSSSTTIVHNYGGGYGGYGYGYHNYYGGNGFVSGFMWGQFFNRPQIVYVGGNQYVAGPNGQPQLDAQGQPVVYQSNPVGTAFAALIWILIFLGLGYLAYRIYRSANE